MLTRTEREPAGAAAEPTDVLLPDAEPPCPGRASVWWRDAASWSVLLALLVWAVPLTHAAGGRDPYALTLALLALVPGLVLTRPWRRLRGWDLLALAPVPPALLACLSAPTGFDGLRTVAALGYAGLLFVLLRGYLAPGARLGGRARVTVVVAALAVAGIDQFAHAWWPWFGRQDVDALLVGTFYWHNQFAVFMAALGLFGAALAMRAEGALRGCGAALAVVLVPSLLYAGSRATLAAALAGIVLLALLSLRRPRSLLTLGGVLAGGAVLAAVIASPLLMDGSQAIGAHAQRTESAVGNGKARLAYDAITVRLVADHPLSGTGTGSFGGASAPLLPSWLSQPSAYVHNGFLQAFVDGGVLLGVAVGVVALLPLVVGVRRAVRRRVGTRRDTADGVTLGALGALGLLAAHSCVDFDWVYPSLLGLYAVVGALLLRPDDDSAAPRADAETATGHRAGRTGVIVGVVVLLALVVALPASFRSSSVASPGAAVPLLARAGSLGMPAAGHGPAWLRGAGECSTDLRAALAAGSTDGVAADLDCLAAYGAVAPSAQLLRARGLTRLGDEQAGQALADGLAARDGDRIPELLVGAAAIPADADRPAAARRAVRAVAADPRVSSDPMALEYARSLLVALGESPDTAAQVG